MSQDLDEIEGVAAETMAVARWIAEALSGAPDIAPGDDGSICFEWLAGDDRKLWIDIGPGDDLRMYVRVGDRRLEAVPARRSPVDNRKAPGA